MKKIIKKVLTHIVGLILEYGIIMLAMWLACVTMNVISYRGYEIGEDTWKIIGIANVVIYILRLIGNNVIAPKLIKICKRFEAHDSKKEISMEESA